jgi:RNA polymerase sigma-70 factor (ECF subfamily)
LILQEASTSTPLDTTSASLLERLRDAAPDDPGWGRLHAVYAPLIRAWLARVPGLSRDADDLAQWAFAAVFRELPGFARQRDGSFRTWLRRVVVNRVRTWRRAKQRGPVAGTDATEAYLARLADPDGDLGRRWDREHDRHVLDALLAAVRPDFQAATWAAFRLFAVEGKAAAEVAVLTGLTENAVLLAKHRVLKRLRQEAAGLLD